MTYASCAAGGARGSNGYRDRIHCRPGGVEIRGPGAIEAGRDDREVLPKEADEHARPEDRCVGRRCEAAA